MYLPKIREIKEALTSFFSPPYTTRFPAKPYTAPPEYRGKPKYYKEYCVGCGTCAQACPATAIIIVDNKERKIRTLTVDYVHALIASVRRKMQSPKKGIKLSNEYSLAVATPKLRRFLKQLRKNRFTVKYAADLSPAATT